MDGAEDTHARPRRAPRRRAHLTEDPHACRPPAGSRAATVAEITALLYLADLDAALVERRPAERAAAPAGAADERHQLGARISPEILEAYDRALRAGRQPAVVPVVASVCSGCHVRLHAKLDHQVKKRRGVAPCPHCLRLVYDPTWLDGAEPREGALGGR